jgi:hypothetical protein
MELKEPPDPRRAELIPVVCYAAERRIASGTPNYWDHAMRPELAVLAKDELKATTALGEALASLPAPLEAETRDRRQEIVPWAREIEEQLERRANLGRSPNPR